MAAGWGRPVAMAGAVGAVVGSFLPLARSGTATRTSYEVVAAAERLGVVTGSGAVAARGWYLVPLVAAAAWVAAVWGARVLLAVTCAMLSVATTTLYVLLVRSPLDPTWFAAVPPVAGAVAAIGAGRHLWEQRGHGRRARPGRTRGGTD